MPILKIIKDDEKAELQFELDYQMSLTSAQRYEMMRKASKRILEILVRNGTKKSFEIIKRPIG